MTTKAHTRRFTPTGVGKIVTACSESFVASVHPHGCGENSLLACTQRLRCGSPPRVWGKFVNQEYDARQARFTPTGVGKIQDTQNRCAPPAVHPHGCGENGPSTRRSIETPGSPPRVWGKCRLKTRRPRLRRFTPTGVGKITLPFSGCSLVSVHPHGCGENTIFVYLTSVSAGSPPRVWGK